jgi:hypothetical protein
MCRTLRKFVRLFNGLVVFGVVSRTVFTFSRRFRRDFGDGPANSAYGFGASRLSWDDGLGGFDFPLSGTICPHLEPIFGSLSPRFDC